jgi:hypothetical protein
MYTDVTHESWRVGCYAFIIKLNPHFIYSDIINYVNTKSYVTGHTLSLCKVSVKQSFHKQKIGNNYPYIVRR